MKEETIQFFYEKSDFKLQEESKLRLWAEDSATAESRSISLLNYIFCDDNYLLDINKQYLEHDYFTDIITFDYSENLDELTGDIFISVDRALDNANTYGEPIDQEIKRLMIHGLLHLIGYKDKEPQDKEIMTAKENLYLKLF
jgi:probable rRNA maturation factor